MRTVREGIPLYGQVKDGNTSDKKAIALVVLSPALLFADPGGIADVYGGYPPVDAPAHRFGGNGMERVFDAAVDVVQKPVFGVEKFPSAPRPPLCPRDRRLKPAELLVAQPVQ